MNPVLPGRHEGLRLVPACGNNRRHGAPPAPAPDLCESPGESHGKRKKDFGSGRRCRRHGGGLCSTDPAGRQPDFALRHCHGEGRGRGSRPGARFALHRLASCGRQQRHCRDRQQRHRGDHGRRQAKAWPEPSGAGQGQCPHPEEHAAEAGGCFTGGRVHSGDQPLRRADHGGPAHFGPADQPGDFERYGAGFVASAPPDCRPRPHLDVQCARVDHR